MENIIYKYSEFFFDDGGFDKIRNDFDKLGDDLVKRAKEIRTQIRLFDADDVQSLKTYESEVEQLMKVFKKYGESKSAIVDIEKAYLEQKKKEAQSNDEQIDALVELDKKLRDHRDSLAEINTLSKLNIKTDRDLNRERIQAEINIKKTNKAIQQQQAEIIKSTELSKKEQKLIQAKITLEKTEMNTLDDVRERMAALRVVVQSMNYKEQADEIKLMNAEIDELTDVLKNNSDTFIQNKINIGNYEESIINAIKGTNLFSGELSFLNGLVEKVIDIMSASTKSIDANTEAKEANTIATSRMGKAIKALNNVAKATGILLFIAAIASIASIFSQGRAGAIATERVMARFAITAKVVISLLADIGWGVVQMVKGMAIGFETVFLKMEKLTLMAAKLSLIPLQFTKSGRQQMKELDAELVRINKRLEETKGQNNFAEGWDKVTTALGTAKESYKNAMAAIKTADKGAIEAFKIADKIKQAELNMIGLEKQVRILEVVSGDSTRSLNTQLAATDQLLNKRLELLKEQSKIEFMNLQLANAKARADAEAQGFRLSGDDVQFARELLALNQKLDPTKNKLDNSLLEESINALKVYEQSLNEMAVAEAEIGKQRREIQRDIFEQNLDLLIDLIDTEKNLSEQFVNDTTQNFQTRINEFNRFLVVFRKNSQKQLDEFTKEASNMGLDLDFQIQYDEDGNFKVFMNDTELATENIVKLNEQLQNSGMNEIDINRFREFMVETRNGVKDFRELNKELTLVGIKINEMFRNIGVSKDELDSLDVLQQKINALKDVEMSATSTRQRKKIIAEIEKLEKEKSNIAEMGEIFRKQNRLKAIDDELATYDEQRKKVAEKIETLQREKKYIYEAGDVLMEQSRLRAIDQEIETLKKGGERENELIQEKLDIEKEIREKGAEQSLEKTKEANQKALDEYKKFADEVRELLSSVLDKALEVSQKQVEQSEKQVDKQNQMVDEQKRRAELGLENTLAFEQKMMAEREAELIKRQKKQERLEKIKALYSSYNNYASRGEENALLKALKDFAALEAIAVSIGSFGEGGIVGVDGFGKVRTNHNDVTVGRSHNMKKGVLAYHEGGEGFFSRQDIQKMGGESAFYEMKSLATSGMLDTNFFTNQGKNFSNSMVVVKSHDPLLANEMKEVKRAIESKPVQNWDVVGVVNGVMELMETQKSKNKEVRNIHVIKKPRP